MKKIEFLLPVPKALIQSLQGIPGFDENEFLAVHQSGEVVTSVRLNPLKSTNSLSLPVDTVVPWCDEGRYLTHRPSFTFDPVFHGGAYYVQEASSMFIDHVLRQLFGESPQPIKALDLCGAPGGKSTLLAAALPGSFIVSNEVIKTRVNILAENITKWGSPDVLVTNNDPKDFSKLPGFFNLMVVDAPCSGSGLFRKDNSAIEEWSEDNVTMCSMRQKRILADAIPSLQQDGYLIYSTCSYSKTEDEDICDWIIDQFQLQPVNISFDESWGIVETFSDKHKAQGLRFFPGKVKGEGFFVAVFQQQNNVDAYFDYHKLKPISNAERQIADAWLKQPGDFVLLRPKELIVGVPTAWQQAAATVQNILHCRKSGVAIGTVKGKDFIPHHELALSGIANENLPVVELDETDALKYLRRQDLQVSSEKKGWAIARHNHVKLGWMKVLPNRVNNYYPTEWRILKP